MLQVTTDYGFALNAVQMPLNLHHGHHRTPDLPGRNYQLRLKP
jgi:fatty acid desaturase